MAPARPGWFLVPFTTPEGPNWFRNTNFRNVEACLPSFEVPKRSPALLAWGFVALWATLAVAVALSARAEPFAYVAHSNPFILGPSTVSVIDTGQPVRL